ncbi:MAG: cytochrome c [Deltaproteobacteria bacterium]|nr:cytochrome c [Deltaproteobacteria bacterium]
MVGPRAQLALLSLALLPGCNPEAVHEPDPKLNQATGGMHGAVTSASSSGSTSGSTGTASTGPTVCTRCESDADCAAGGFCVEDLPHDACTAPCGPGGTCPDGQACFQVGNRAGQTGCYPVVATCADFGSTTGGSSGGGCTPDTWNSSMKSFFDTHCNGCHAFDLGDVRRNSDTMIDEINSGRMPPGESLDQAQIDAVVAWIGCGAP